MTIDKNPSLRAGSNLLDPDLGIVKRMADGEHKALAELMDRHLSGIKSMAWHMSGDEMIAEEIAQEVFLRAWEQAKNWQEGRALFKTWLYRIGKNLCIDQSRKKKEIPSDTLPEMIDLHLNADDEIIKKQRLDLQKQKIELAISALPERQKLAIVLFHYQGIPQNQAAEIMGVGVRAFESLLARARRNLRDRLIGDKHRLLE